MVVSYWQGKTPLYFHKLVPQERNLCTKSKDPLRGNSKLEALNPKQIQIEKDQNSKRYDLEERTEEFARRVGEFVEGLPKTMSNLEYGQHLIRASGSVGANYIEANEALSKKDFVMRIKICRKESKESGYWLRLVHCHEAARNEQQALIQDATELMKIFGAIFTKSG